MPRLLLAALVALLAPIALAPAALAQTCTTSWTNPAGGAWEQATNWSAGVPSITSTACITLAGTYTVAEAGTNRSVAGLVLGGASGTQTLAIGNSFTVTADGVVRPNGRMELLNPQGGGLEGLYTGGTVTVEGVLVHRGGTTLLDGGGTLDVAPGGRLELREGASVGVPSRPSTYRIRGTLDAAFAGSGQQINLPLDVQGGTIRVSQGRLDVRGATLANATVDAAAGATLYLFGSSTAGYTVSGTLSGAPAGDVFFNGGRVTAAAGGATLNVGGVGLLLGGNVVLTGGTFRNTGRLVQADGIFSAVDGTTLLNAGRFVIPGTDFGVQNGGRIRNEASGTLEIAGGGGIGFNGTADGRLENAGVLLHTALTGSGSGTGAIRVPYDGLPGSVVRMETGRLDFQVGGTLRDVSFDVPAETEVNFQGGGAPLTFTGTLSGTPAGDLRVRDVLRAAAGPGGVTFAVGGTGLQVAGAARLVSAGGQFVNTGLLVWTATRVDQVVLENRGTLRLLGSFFLENGAVARNVAGATTELYAPMAGDGRFDNAGLLVAGGTGGAVIFNGRLRSLPGSEIRALAGGPRLDLDAPGARTLPDGTTLSGTGSVLFRAGLEPEGTVSPGTEAQPVATLSSFNAYLPSLVAGSPRLVIDVAGGGQSDVFAIDGATRLVGALVVRVRPGYVPAVGDQFTILTSSGITGQFAQVAVDGAPAGVAFVAEVAPGGTALVLRAVAAAPGGPITVSAGGAVSGGLRTLFLSGPGAAGISAARLVCTDCLDAAAFGTVVGTISGTETLKEARFTLTDSRAFGFYDLVVTRPGQPDVSVPVTIRPYISSVVTRARYQTGIRVRPASAPGQRYNFSPHGFENRTNGPAAFPFGLFQRPAPGKVSLVITSNHAESGEALQYESDTATDPLAQPLFSAAVPANDAGSTDFEVGLRIDPSDVLFPEQTRTGPDDDRLLFNEAQPFNTYTTANTTLERATFTLRQGFLNTADPALRAYVAQVAAADPQATALDVAVRTALSGQQRAISTPRTLLAQILDGLGTVVPAPAGLAASAATAFGDSLLTAVNDLAQREVMAYADALAASTAVRDLYVGELTALGIDYGPPPAPRPARALTGWASQRGDGYSGTPTGGTNYTPSPDAPPPVSIPGFGCSIDAIEAVPDIANPVATSSPTCPPTRAPADPNDKLADSDLLCAFGTVTVGGEQQTRCVRYFVPRARATEPVAYTITFENLAIAMAPAEFVTITDDIDPAFDIASLRIESTSSDSTFSYSVSGRTVTFRFVGIDLPPNVTAPEGEGFVRYSLRPNAGLPDGTEIRNTAGIVFDFNPPIQTPTVLHEIRTVADVAAVITAPDFVVVGTAAPITVTVANLRGDVATAAAVTIQTGGVAAQVTPSSGSCTAASPFVCTFGDLAAGETATVGVAFASAPAGTALTVSATATTTAFDAFAANDTDLVSVGVATVGTEADPDVPRELTLSSPRPNPVRGATTLRWGLPAAAAVDVRVYDLLGREVARLADGEAQEAGWHEARWEAGVASGVYVVRVRVGDDVRTRRLTVIR